MPFLYRRTIRFPDTDAAGVVFFANSLRICHEAYEASLEEAGIELAAFFSASDVIVPIAEAKADYLRPLRCGDQTRVSVTPAAINEHSFLVTYEIVRLGMPGKTALRASTRHVCIRASSGRKTAMPPGLAAWLEKFRDQ